MRSYYLCHGPFLVLDDDCHFCMEKMSSSLQISTSIQPVSVYPVGVILPYTRASSQFNAVFLLFPRLYTCGMTLMIFLESWNADTLPQLYLLLSPTRQSLFPLSLPGISLTSICMYPYKQLQEALLFSTPYLSPRCLFVLLLLLKVYLSIYKSGSPMVSLSLNLGASNPYCSCDCIQS